MLLIACGDDAAEPEAKRPEDAAAEAPARAIPDLRFKWVGEDLAYRVTVTQNVLNTGSGFDGCQGTTGSRTATPLELWLEPRSRDMPMADLDAGPDRDYGKGSWFYGLFEATPRVEALSTCVTGGLSERFDADVAAFAEEHKLVTSFDLAIAASEGRDTYAAVAVGREDQQERSFDRFAIVSTSRTELAAAVQTAADGHSVTTALAGDGERIRFVSYMRNDDAKVYETSVLEADYDNLEQQAQALGDDGYLITAFGRDAEVLLLVGTRSAGSEPHRVELLQARELPTQLPGAIVAYVSSGKGQRKVIVQH